MIKKILKYVGLGLLAIIVAVNAYVLITGKMYFYKAVYYNLADYDDYKIFPGRKVKIGTPQPWPVSASYNTKKLPDSTRTVMDLLGTLAIVVIKNDSIVYEEYAKGYDPNSYVNSFSMAKTITSLLIGAAISDGYIKSVDQPVGDFLPSFAKDGKEKITIRHLLTMSSGTSWDESYINPLSMTTEAYYGTDLPGLIEKLEAKNEPGKEFDYLSGDTEILGILLTKAVGKPLGEYASEKLWQPLGAENDALWSTDVENGMEKAYCCFNSVAKDFARIGWMAVNNGKWKGKQIIDSTYLAMATAPSGLSKKGNPSSKDFYGFQWWVIPSYRGTNIFYARGILGQYIICVPEKNTVIVRLGKIKGPLKPGTEHYYEVFNLADLAWNF